MPGAVAGGLQAAGVEVVHDAFFDTVLARVPGRATAVQDAAKEYEINIWRVDDDHRSCLLRRSHHRRGRHPGAGGLWGRPGRGVRRARYRNPHNGFPDPPGVHRVPCTETSMMRYLRTLADKDLALDRTMIPLRGRAP